MKVSPEMRKLLLERGTVGPAPKLPGQPQKKVPPGRTGQSRYGNVKVEVDGIKFHSKREAKRWLVLKRLLAAGAISMLRRQVRFRLAFNGVFIRTYVADFTYIESGRLVVEDCKGYRTEKYITKRRLMLACHGITILET